MNRKQTIVLMASMIALLAIGFASSVSAETFGEHHASIGPSIPADPTNEDCLKCHSSMLKDGDTEGIKAFHITHVETMSMSCIQCHKVDEELPTLKQLVSEDTCVPCHKEGSMGREIFTSAGDDMQTTTDDKETTTSDTTTVGDDDEETPGFEAIFAVTGLLAVAYLVLRRNR